MRRPYPLQRIHSLKATIVALLALGVGIALLTLACHIADDPLWDLPSFWPLSALGGILVGSGFLGIVWDYIDGNDREARDDERVRRLVKEAARNSLMRLSVV